MATHTAGPWRVSELDGRNVGPVRIVSIVEGGQPCDVPQLQSVAIVRERVGESDANARLIAAAPELLQVIEDYLEWGAMTGSDHDLFAQRFRAAIAKAKGRP